MTQPITTIVGAGLCGLATAYRLKQAGVEVTVLEANHCIGGRIQPAGNGSGHQDLGPTWVWPGAQPVVTQWVNELELALFEQFDTGNGLLDEHPNEQATQQQLLSQQGSARFVGGTYALIKQLEKKLSNNVVKLNQEVTGCQHAHDGWQLTVARPNSGEKPELVTTDRLIIATPPRLATVLFGNKNPALAEVVSILSNAETWMAPHAKVVVFYDTPFWRETGLSGRIASRVGPLVEIHDHSGPEGTPAALFGFSGVPAETRAQSGEQFVESIRQQLQRCFGPDAPAPIRIEIKDWAFEPFTTTAADRHSSGAHPPVLARQVRQSYCNNSLWFAGSETASISAGLIEGALARADEVATQFLATG